MRSKSLCCDEIVSEFLWETKNEFQLLRKVLLLPRPSSPSSVPVDLRRPVSFAPQLALVLELDGSFPSTSRSLQLFPRGKRRRRRTYPSVSADGSNKFRNHGFGQVE